MIYHDELSTKQNLICINIYINRYCFFNEFEKIIPTIKKIIFYTLINVINNLLKM